MLDPAYCADGCGRLADRERPYGMFAAGDLIDMEPVIAVELVCREHEVTNERSSKRCDRCGKFTRFLHAIPANPSEGGWDHEQCCLCRHPGLEHEVTNG